MNKYIKQYKWSNIFTMIRNQNLDPTLCTKRCEGQLVVITGATSGIGYAAAEKFAACGADILSINRNETKSQALCEHLQTEYGVEATYIIADFSRLSDVHQAGEKLAALERRIDVLIHNAGVFMTDRQFTGNDIEQVFQTNYLSTFIINHHILDKMKRQQGGRIVFVNSEAHRFAVWGLHLDDLRWEHHHYTGMKSYGAAKTAQLLSMIKFNALYAKSGVTINAMHPGNVRTNSGQNNGKLYQWYKKHIIDPSARSIDIASESLYYLGVSDEVVSVSGRFFNLTTLEEPAPPALDTEQADRLWEISLDIGECT